MEITEIAFSLRDEEKLKAFVNVTFDDQFVIRGMKVIKGGNKYFLSMPSKRLPNGGFRDVAHPITKEFREMLEMRVLEEYFKQSEEYFKQSGEGPTSQSVSK